MDFKKPPVVEVLCEFHFIGGEDAPDFEPVAVRKFLAAYEAKFAKIEDQVQREVTFKVTPDGKISHEPLFIEKYHRARAYSSDGSEILQLSKDLLIYNLIKRGNCKPRFETLLQPAMKSFSDYVDFFVPERLRSLVLRYVDIIEIPHIEFTFSDYFATSIDVHEPKANQTGIQQKVDFVIGEREDVLSISMRDLKSRDGDGVSRFRLDWTVEGKSVTRATEDEVESWFRSAHDILGEWFKKFLHKPCLDLFEPLSEDG